MNTIYNSPLFDKLTALQVDQVLEKFGRIKKYTPEQVIALRQDTYNALLIVIEGVVRGEMINHNGERVIIEEIEAPRAIAPAFLFATDNRLPVDVIAVKKTAIVSIRINEFTELLQQNKQILNNYLRIMADRSRFLSDRLRQIQFGSLKNKIATYLCELMQNRQSREFKMPNTQQELADLFGVARPSIARIIAKLVDEGLIESNKGNIRILAPQQLKAIMKE